jgi:hypothetical protein
MVIAADRASGSPTDARNAAHADRAPSRAAAILQVAGRRRGDARRDARASKVGPQGGLRLTRCS